MEVLECLRKHGQLLDLEIAEEIGASLESVRKSILRLTASGDVIKCTLTRYDGARRIDAWQCRVAGYVPARAPGRKPTS